MVAPASLRKRLRKLPQAKPAPVCWTIDVYPDGRELDHWTGRPWPVPEYLSRPAGVPDLVLRLPMGDESEVKA